MKEPFDQEMLSAYLDGELTAAQQARVERLLAENPEAKQLLDELRALSATLQLLPQEKIGEDLSPYVLRQAERELLTGSRPTAPARLRLRQMLSHMLSRRALAWAAAAVVIAVFFTISEYYQRRREGDRAVAVGRAKDAVAVGRAKDKDKDAAVAGGATHEQAPAGDLAPPAGRRPPAIHAPGVVVEDDQTPTRPSAVVSKEPPAPRVAEKRGGRAAPGVSPTWKDEQLLAESKPAPGKETAAKSLPEPIRPDERATPREGGGRGVPLAEGTATAAPMPEAKPGLERPEGVVPGSVKTEPPMVAAGRLRLATPVADGAGSECMQVAAQPEGVVVVRCDITPEAARNRALDQLLVRNNIALEDGAALAGGHQKSAESRVREESPAHAAPGSQLAKEKADTAAAAAAEASGLDVVYVEAAPEQIEPVLAAMNAMPSQFLTVTVEPPPQAQLQRTDNLTASQYDFSRYNRAKPAADSQQPGTATQELKLPVAAPAAGARVFSAQQGVGRGGAVVPGKVLEEQWRAGPGQPGDKPSAPECEGDDKPAGRLAQQIGGFSGRAVRVQLPQKRAADNVVQTITNGSEVGKPPPGSASVVRSEVNTPLDAKGAKGFAGSGMAGPPEARPGHSLSGKGKSDTGAPAVPAEAPASAARPVAAPRPAPADPGRDRPQDFAAESAQADDQAKQDKGKAASGPPEPQQWQQTGGVCRVLFVIRVVPESPAAHSAEPAAEKSQARE